MGTERRRPQLFFLFDVHRVLAQAGGEFLDLEFFPTRLFANGVVVVASFLANEVHDFQLSLAFTFFCHWIKNSSISLSIERGIVTDLFPQGNG